MQKENSLFFVFPSVSNFSVAKVAENRVQNKTNNLFSFEFVSLIQICLLLLHYQFVHK